MIPLERLGEYTDFIERINIEFSLANKLKLAARLGEFFAGPLPVYADAKVEGPELFADRPQQALELIDRVARRWAFVAANLDRVAREVTSDLEGLGMDSAKIGRDPEATLFARVQLHHMRISWKEELREELRRIFSGRDFEPVMAAIEKIHSEVLRSRVFVALHMHAGDGNVHTNIPVNSDDYQMLHEANQAVARIMAFARSLGGVISGEHGIGITKLEFLTPEEVGAFVDYKKRVDPEGRFVGQPGMATNVTFDAPALRGATNVVLPRADHREVAFAPFPERGGQDRQGGRREQRSAEALEGAERDQRALRPGEPVEERAHREEHEARDEQAPTTEEIGEPAAQQEHAAEEDGVGGDHPLQAFLAEVEAGLDRRQGDVHDRDVEDDHELGDDDGREADPPPRIGGGGSDRPRHYC